MTSSLFISALPGSLQLAKTHQGRLEEFSWLTDSSEPVLNGVYLGEVSAVLPGIQGAFLDLGQGQQAFLNRSGLPEGLLPSKKTKLNDVLKQGQKLVVQIRKHAMEGKQVQVSAKLRLLGFFCICLPGETGFHFSKKFSGNREQVHLASGEDVSQWGWIIRSSAAEVPFEWLQTEMAFLSNLAVGFTQEVSGKARVLWEPDAAQQWIMDRAFPAPSVIYVDDEAEHGKLERWLTDRQPSLRAKLQRHSGDQRMFDVYKIQSQVEKAMASRVWLPSGGMLDIRQTPALVSIDVNSGKHTKARGGIGAALRTNLEAIQEIARQLRIRNLAGLVVIDFIDMNAREARDKLMNASRKAFAGDDASIDLTPLNRFNLLCLSRERRGTDLNRQTMRVCPTCKGSGWTAHFSCLAVTIQTEIVTQGEALRGHRVSIRASQRFADYLRKHRHLLFEAFEQGLKLQIQIEPDPGMDPNRYEMTLKEESP